MHGLRIWLLGAVIVIAACQRRADGPEVTVIGEATRLRHDDGLPARSGIFDGSVVRLRGVRGEVLGVQVVREARGAGRAGRGAVPVTLVIDRVRVEAFAVDHHDVRTPSTAMYGGSRGEGSYPDRLRPVRGPDGAPLATVATERAAYFDVAIPGDAAAGTHHGTLTVGGRGFAVELVVEDLALAAGEPPWVWAYYDPRELKRAGVVDETGFVALFRAHGVVAAPELTLDTWTARRPQLAGMRFFPVLLPRDPAAIDAEVRAWIELTRGSGQVPFAIPIDEPRRIVDQLRVRARAAIVRAAGGGPGRFLYAVTQRPSWLLGPDVDVHISPFGGDWTYNGTPPWAGAMVLDADDPGMRTWGWIGFRHATPLWYVWDAAYWRDRYNDRRGRDAAPLHDLVASPVTFDDGEDRGNLDGALAFPSPDGATLPSLRLKALRRGLQDRALLEQLAACAGRATADAIAAPLFPRSLGTAARGDAASWPTGPAAELALDAARHRVLDALLACPP